MTTAITENVARFVAMKRKLGYRFKSEARVLRSFARFAAAQDEAFIRSATVLEWATTAASQPQRVKRLHTVHRFARWLRAEDTRHELPPREALGRAPRRRPQPHLVSVRNIGKLLAAALATPPAGTIAPLTWHYMFGLVAATGLRLGEALALTLNDITPDGLIIRDTKFGKSRMVALHPSTRSALNRYLVARCKQSTPDGHLFVLGTGRPPSPSRVDDVFRKLAHQTGIRESGAKRGPSLHSLRHSFAVRSLEDLRPGADPGRHMLALATYLGHANVSDTYWYLESTPALMRGIADAAEQAHKNGETHD